MARVKLNSENIEALLIGLGIFGTGGGGDPEWGLKILENDLAHGRVCEIIDPEDIEDDAFVCSGGIMGSVKTLGNVSHDEIVAKWEDDFVLIKAFKEMEKIKGKELDYIIPFEAGGLNTPVMMSLAARMGIPIINGDAVGRSAPETQMTSFIGHGISLTPMPLVDHLGNVIVVMEANETTYADEIGRFVVTKGGGLGGNSHYAMTGSELKRSCVPHVITDAIEYGKAILDAREKGLDPVKAFSGVANGKIMFTGVIENVAGDDKGGFYLTNVSVKGTKEFAGRKLDSVFKNETMVVWVDGEIKSIFPDIAFILDPKTGSGLMSADLEEGQEIAFVGRPCHKRVRESIENEKGKIAFGGARYGHPEIQFVPFEELNK